MNQPIPVSAVQELENENLKRPQVNIPVKHYFAKGVYAREITVPAGLVITGRVHAQSQVNILSKGRMKVTTETGVVEVEAPFTVVSPPGTKRAAYTLTECVWTTVLGTWLTDPKKIHDRLTFATEQEYLAYVEKQKWLS